jgi:predicted NUDIX family NTP pyrophosphohydrolase
MPVHSAGLIPLRVRDGVPEVFLAHMGGPFWARKDDRAWSIVKGEYDPAAEEPRAVAVREFAEEIGAPCPPEPWVELGAFRQPSGKVITAYAVVTDVDLAFVESNEFEVEWPKGSGVMRRFPEVDRAQWWPLPQARTKVVAGQVPMIEQAVVSTGSG